MKPTLNEEIGMSYEANQYVSSLIVKDEEYLSVLKHIESLDSETRLNLKASDLSYEKINNHNELVRIRKQARNSWICIAVILILTLILNWK